MKRAALVLVSILIVPAWLHAQTSIDERRAAAADGTVEIENPFGSVAVMGWDQPEVHVTGTLARGSELDLEAAERHVRIEVDVEEDHGHSEGSKLEVHVPSGSHVEIEGVQLEITASDVTGSVEAESVSGGISLTGATAEVNLQSVNGPVEVSGPRGRIEVEAVNGPVTIRDASGHVDASTVNGELIVGGGPFERAALESVAGAVRFEADLATMGRLEVETVSGTAEIAVPASVKADFSISTFSGEIENELGVGTVEQEQYVPAKTLTFSTGSGGARISVETLSGDIHIRKR